MYDSTITLIKKYYDYFNKWDMEKFFELLDDNIVHDLNQGQQEIGKTAFEKFMQHMNRCYSEKIRDLVVMTDVSGKRAAAEFIVDGVYQASDKGLPAANNQKYTLPAGAFFEIDHGKIKRVTTYYNLPQWIKLVSK